jgi:uncharacterized membrane protein YjgN (DUF898 family)
MRRDYDVEFCNVITHASALAFASYHFLTDKPDMEPIDTESQKKRISSTCKRLLLFSFAMLDANSIMYHAFVTQTRKTLFKFIDHFSVVITMIGTTAQVISVLFSVIAAFVFSDSFSAWSLNHGSRASLFHSQSSARL